MACQILVSNNSSAERGHIVSIVSQDHVFSANESMQEFIKFGGKFDDWARVFSIVKVTDKTKEELEYLQEYLDIETKRYYFVEPELNSSEWLSLYNTGEIEKPFSIVEKFIRAR